MLTMKEYLEICESMDYDESEKDSIVTLEQCNEWEEMGYLLQGRWKATAREWAEFFIAQSVHEREADAREYRQFCYDAYGE